MSIKQATTEGNDMITSTEFTNKDNFNTIYNTFRGDFLEAHGLDRNKKGVRIATGVVIYQKSIAKIIICGRLLNGRQ